MEDKLSLPQVLRAVINKETVPERKGRGRKGYGNLGIARMLVYSQAKDVHTDKGLIRHANNNMQDIRRLGFDKVPHRTTIGRWKKKDGLMRSVLRNLGRMLAPLLPLLLAVIDSTPLIDYRDADARTGYNSRGPFKGFKAHIICNQLGLPLDAVVTAGNVHDTNGFPELVGKVGFPVKDNTPVLADGAYDSRDNRMVAKSRNFTPFIATNPRNTGKRRHVRGIIKKNRYVAGQCNSLLKAVLKGSWVLVRGLAKKAATVYSALAAIDAIAISAILRGKEALKEVSEYWY